MTENEKKIIAKNIVYLRTGAHMTQAELADKLNYSDKAISKWERGDSIPDIFVLRNIASMFGVNLEFFFSDRIEEKKPDIQMPNNVNRNHMIITALSVLLVWTLATIAYVVIQICTNLPGFWLLFVYSVPVSSIIMLIFNSIWGNARKNKYIISLLMWSLLISLALTFTFVENRIWLILIIGIPSQAAIIIWFMLDGKKK